MKNLKKAIVIVIIIGLIIYGCYYVIRGVSKNSKEEQSKLNQNDFKSNEINEDIEKNDGFKEENVYRNVIEDYKAALEEYNINEYMKIEDKYPLVGESLISYVKINSKNNIGLGYTYYDIDNNGRKELIVGITNQYDSTVNPAAIYTYTKDEQVKKIYVLGTIERGLLSIYDNAVIFSMEPDGAATYYYKFCKISDEGDSTEILEEVREEYKTEKNVIYYNEKNDDELDYKNNNEMIEKYIKGNEEVKFNVIGKI